MLNISGVRFLWTFLIGFLIASNFNWAIAEFFLNDWAAPRFDGFMRTMETGADPTSIIKMSVGFGIPLFVAAWLHASLSRPVQWYTRAIVVGMLVSIAAFYGTYTFISGWGNVNWWPLMVTATCDMASIVPGTVLIAFLQRGRVSGG